MVKVYVMHTCPDCMAVMAKIEDESRFQVIDIGEHVHNMKEFLHLRDTSPTFDAVKARGAVGIPCFVMENGDISFSFDEADASETGQGASCSLDGKGC